MLIDLILNRKDNQNIIIKKGKCYTTSQYDAKRFYNDISNDNVDGLYNDILLMLDSGDELDIKKVLANYIIYGDYNLDIIKYIYSVN
ncbi:MAG: hypothetical protein PHI09_05755 [Candidatus Omnitrophica bacterium]|nr:hypothetical protein [Candidatus Omnitrophota bacterium]